MSRSRRLTLRKAYEQLLAAHGPRDWWPGDSPFEIMVGAILTQNTAWTNVEKAIAALKARNRLAPQAILAARRDHLAHWIRPSGYFNIKAERLRQFCRWYLDQGGWDVLCARDTERLRQELLAVKGIGPETADDMLLYAFERPVFVIDAYTRRIFSRLGLVEDGLGYEELRTRFEQELGSNVALFNEYHALIVQHGKDVCRMRPRCSECVLARACAWQAQQSG
ncbi:MAG: endonuclease [Gammaproteobacteria bacterium]|nr:endonuclease [Gammaproteobacteria bacterium]